MILSQWLKLPLIISLAAGLAAAPAFAQAGSGAAASQPDETPLSGPIVEDIVARVNDQIVTQSDYDRAVQQLDAEAKQQDLTPQDLQQRKSNLLRDLIDQQLLLSKGKELGITGENELVRQLDEIRKQNHLASLEDLEKAAQDQGVSYEDFKANIRNGIITQQVVRDEVGRHLDITPAEVQSYFHSHESEFAQPESVHLSEIMVPTAGPAGGEADAAQVADAQQKADALEAKLRAGADFADLAKTSSSGSTAAQGGDLGDFRRGMLAPQLEAKTFNLQAGQYTEPIRTKQGFIILKVTQHIRGGDASFKDVEPKVEEALFLERMQPSLRAYLTTLREQAYIDIKPGYVDSAASPDEIHPSYTAYVPPSAKKKKKFARVRFRGRDRSKGKILPNESMVAANNAAKTATPAATSARSAKSQKPGKREKIRFGQAPLKSLPPAANQPSETATESGAKPAAGTAQVANAANNAPANNAPNQETQYINPDGSVGPQNGAPAQEVKTRFSQRAIVHKPKKTRAQKAQIPDTPSKPSADEVASQKVQNAPLGLAASTAKKKKTRAKGPKTRYADKAPKPPAPTPQPYLGPPTTSGQLAPASGNQPNSPATPAATQP